MAVISDGDKEMSREQFQECPQSPTEVVGKALLAANAPEHASNPSNKASDYQTESVEFEGPDVIFASPTTQHDTEDTSVQERALLTSSHDENSCMKAMTKPPHLTATSNIETSLRKEASPPIIHPSSTNNDEMEHSSGHQVPPEPSEERTNPKREEGFENGNSVNGVEESSTDPEEGDSVELVMNCLVNGNVGPSNPPSTDHFSSTFDNCLVKQPDGDIEQPNGDIEQPDGDIEQPDGDIEQPDGDIEQPDGDIEQPDGDIEQPNGDIEQPDCNSDGDLASLSENRQQHVNMEVGSPPAEPSNAIESDGMEVNATLLKSNSEDQFDQESLNLQKFLLSCQNISEDSLSSLTNTELLDGCHQIHKLLGVFHKCMSDRLSSGEDNL